MHATYLSNTARTAQQLHPIRVPHSIADSDSELRNSVLVTHSGGETAYPSLPFDATPCDGRLRQRVERVTFERRATGCEHHQHRLVRGRHASTLAVRA